MKTLEIYLKFWSIKLFFILLGIVVVFEAYLYATNYHNEKYSMLILKIHERLYNAPEWLHMVDYFILVFVLAVVIILLMTIYYNSNKLIEEEVDKRFVDGLLNKVFLFLYPIEEYTEKQKKIQLREIKKNIRSDHGRMLFIHYLREIHNQTTGVISKKTDFLIKEIKYRYFIRALLYSPYIHHKLFALKAIGDFQFEGFEKYILKLTKRKNELIHSEAIITLLKLKIYDNLLFLVDLKMTLTLWDINKIVSTIQELSIVNIDYSTLIKSEIAEISALGIILAKSNGRIEFKNDIKKIIENKNEFSTEEALIALCVFATEQEDYIFLIENYNATTERAKTAILKQIIFIEDQDILISFLDNVIENQLISQKIIAMKSLLELDFGLIGKYKNSKNKLVKQAYNQILDINL